MNGEAWGVDRFIQCCFSRAIFDGSLLTPTQSPPSCYSSHKSHHRYPRLYASLLAPLLASLPSIPIVIHGVLTRSPLPVLMLYPYKCLPLPLLPQSIPPGNPYFSTLPVLRPIPNPYSSSPPVASSSNLSLLIADNPVPSQPRFVSSFSPSVLLFTSPTTYSTPPLLHPSQLPTPHRNSNL